MIANINLELKRGERFVALIIVGGSDKHASSYVRVLPGTETTIRDLETARLGVDGCLEQCILQKMAE